MMHETTVIRDEKSGAVLNIQNGSLQEYKLRKQKLNEKDRKITSLEERLTNIEKMMEKLVLSQSSNS